MKKYVVMMTLVLALSMVLAACGPAATPTTAPTTKPTEAPTTPVEQPTTAPTEATTEAPTQASTCPLQVEDGAVITFSGWGDESEQKIYKDTIERFKSICPGVTVNYTPVPSDFQTQAKGPNGRRYCSGRLLCG